MQNTKGYFCITITLIAVILLISLFYSFSMVSEIQGNAVAAAIEAEKAGFERFQFENNIEIIIRETIEKELLSHSDSAQVKKAVNLKIKEYSEKLKKKGYEVYITNGFGFHSVKEIEDFSTAIVLEKDSVKYAEYFFTGGLLKNYWLGCRFEKGSAVAEAKILPGYTVRGLKIG